MPQAACGQPVCPILHAPACVQQPHSRRVAPSHPNILHILLTSSSYPHHPHITTQSRPHTCLSRPPYPPLSGMQQQPHTHYRGAGTAYLGARCCSPEHCQQAPGSGRSTSLRRPVGCARTRLLCAEGEARWLSSLGRLGLGLRGVSTSERLGRKVRRDKRSNSDVHVRSRWGASDHSYAQF